MNTKGLALLSAAAFLSMSEVASAGRLNIMELLEDLGIIRSSESALSKFKLKEPGRLDLDEVAPRSRFVPEATREVWAKEIRTASGVYGEATPQILHDLETADTPTREELERIINTEVTNAVQLAAKEPKSGITFEALNGTLKFDQSVTLGGLTVTGGEVNIYKVTGAVAATVYTCQLLSAMSKPLNGSSLSELGLKPLKNGSSLSEPLNRSSILKNCAKKALADVVHTINDEFDSKDPNSPIIAPLEIPE
jgi:hypothetical protein